MPPAPIDDALVGSTLGGRYHVVAPLGRGGAGTVYRAVQHRLGREVAVKVVRVDLPPEQVELMQERFLREAELASQLSHPNVVTYIDAGTTADGQRYVVMELLRGRTLREALQSGPLPAEQCARCVADLARGVAHAHRRGLVHRDVKPANVFLVGTDGEGERPVLVDFGLVKDSGQDSHLTQTGAYMGTPPYMSPEQARGDSTIGPGTDVYALGCVLFKMLTGVLPFEASNAIGLAMKHISDPVPAMSARAPNVRVDPAIEGIVRRCLEKNAEKRPTADQLAALLDGWLATTTAAPAATRVGLAAAGGAAVASVVAVAMAGALMIAAAVAWLVLSPTRHPPAAELPLVAATPPIAPHANPAEVPAPPTGASPAAPVASPAAPVASPGPASGAPEVRPPSAPEAPRTWMADVDGVLFDAAHARRALRFVNEVDADALAAAGVYADGIPAIVEGRPFPTLEAFGHTKGVGPKTVEAVAAATAADRDAWLARAARSDDGALEVDGVRFTEAEAAAALAWVNAADRDALVAAGIYADGVDLLLRARPFSSLPALGATPGVGSDTVRKVAAASARK